MKNPRVDFVLDCSSCGQMFVFANAVEREEEMRKHIDHDFDHFLQRRI